MDFFIMFALLGLVALARITIGLRGIPQADLAAAAPCGAMDWVAVRAQIFGSTGAARTERAAMAAQRRAKAQRRWVRRQAVAADRAKALAAGRLARLAARVAAKAAARAKSAEVAERYGHAAQRAAAAVRAARKAAAAAGAVPFNEYGIKARKRATRGSCCAANALKRATNLAAAQQRNAAARAAADAANAAFTASRAVKAAAQSARAAWVDLRREALGPQQNWVWTAAEAKAAAREAKAAAREAKAAKLAEAKALANISWEQSQKARMVLRLERKAAAKAGLLGWLAAGNGQVTKTAASRLAELEAAATGAALAFWLQTGVSASQAADRLAVRAAREAIRAARRQVVA